MSHIKIQHDGNADPNLKFDTKGYRRGVHFEFENGYTVSIQMAPTNYCEHHHIRKPVIGLSAIDTKSEWSSKDAEIAVIQPDGKFVRPWRYGCPGQSDSVVGWVTPDKIAQVLNRVRKWKK